MAISEVRYMASGYAGRGKGKRVRSSALETREQAVAALIAEHPKVRGLTSERVTFLRIDVPDHPGLIQAGGWDIRFHSAGPGIGTPVIRRPRVAAV